jgi:N-terminal acetyltransferase B complex non-catalytic subunit
MMERPGYFLSKLQKLQEIPSKGQRVIILAKLTDNPSLLQDSKALVARTLEKQGNLRTAHKALLAITQAQELSAGTHDTILQVCEDYWQKFRRKAYCFEDIKNVLSELGRQIQEKFLDILSSEGLKEEAHGTKDTSNSTNPALNLLKLRYCFSLPKGVSQEQLERFACDALDIYCTSLDGTSKCPEAALLGAMALVRLAFAGLAETKSAPRYDRYLLQAVFVLETCRSMIEDYYPYSLLLLQIKPLLGLMSLAMTDFRSLNVKNVQWETTGHLLLTRISTTHPRSAGTASPSEEPGVEPLRVLASALFMSESSGETLSTQIRSGLKSGSYVNVIESVDMRSDLENSLNKHIFIQEEARIKQLLSVPDVEDIPLRPSRLVDNRDFTYLPNYESEGSPAFGEYLRPGPLPRERWLAAITLYNQTVRCLKGELYGHHAPSINEIELFQTALAASSDADVKELTDVELDNLKAHISLASAVVAMKHLSGPEDPGLDKHVYDLGNWLRNQVGFPEEPSKTDDDSKKPKRTNQRYTLHLGSRLEIGVPSWTYLHHAFSLLETLQGISLLLAVLDPKSTSKSTKSKAKQASVPADTISTMQEMVEQVETGIHKNARELKRELNSPGMLGRLMNIGLGRDEEQDDLSPVGKVLDELADATNLEVLCGDMRESWEDALDGILALKVKAK